MSEEKDQKGFLKKFGKWAPIIGGAWIVLNIVLPLALLRIPAVQKFLVAAADKLPFDIPGIGQMNFADNWARVLVVVTFLTFGETQVIGGLVPNLIAFGLFLGAIGYFALTGKMAEMFRWKKKK